MVRNKKVINEKFTELVNKYVQMGYTINVFSMKGADGSSRVDLIKGNDFIRVFTKRESAFSYNKDLYYNYAYDNDVCIVAVGKMTIDNVGKFIKNNSDPWTKDLEVVEKYVYYGVGSLYRENGFTDDIKDIIEIGAKTNRRLMEKANYSENRTKYTDIDRLRIGLRIVKKQPRTKTIHLENINYVEKVNSRYSGVYYNVVYTTNSGKTNSVICRKK